MLGKGYLCAVVTQDAANWPTPSADGDSRPGANADPEKWQKLYEEKKALGINKQLFLTTKVAMEEAAKHGQAAPANPSTDGSRQGLWPTARSLDGMVSESLGTWEARRIRKAAEGINLHRPLPIAVMQEQFPTPRACDWKSSPDADSNIKRMASGQATLGEFVHAKEKQWRTPSVAEEKNQNTSTQIYLQNQVGATPKAWATPNCRDSQGVPGPAMANQKSLPRDMKKETGSGRLNGQWVTQLMGLPMGWVTPSCPASVIRNWPRFVSGWLSATIAPTNSDSSETESCQQPQKELFEF
jgi:hypothetical protein